MDTKTVDFTTKACTVCKKASIVKVNPVALKRWQNGELVQRCFPSMSTDDRELLISGTHSHCWDKLFGEGEN